MGLLVNGEWHTDWYDTQSTNGEFIRQGSQFEQVTPSHEAGEFPAQAGRYIMYRWLVLGRIALNLASVKAAADVVGVTVVKAEMLDKGWELRLTIMGR